MLLLLVLGLKVNMRLKATAARGEAGGVATYVTGSAKFV